MSKRSIETIETTPHEAFTNEGVMMSTSILLCGMAREGEYDHVTRYGSGETAYESTKLEFH